MVLEAIGQGATIAIVIKAIDKFSNEFSHATTLLGKFKTIGIAAAAAVGTSMIALGASSLKAAADFEQTQIAFETMLGSAEAGQKLLKEIADFARRTPFTIPEVEEQTKRLLAYGIAQEEVLGDMKTLGDIASGVGKDKLPFLTLAFGQVATAGKLRGQEIRQFTEAGVPLIEALANTMGKTGEEIIEMTSKGEIGFNDVKKALESLTSEGGRFENLMARQAETVGGKFSNLQDTFTVMQREIGAALLPVVAQLADVLLEDLLPAVQPLIPIIGEFLSGAFKEIIDLIVPLLPDLIEITGVFLELASVVIDILAPALEILIPILKLIAQLVREALEIIQKLIDVTANSFIGDIVRGTGKVLKGLTSKIPKIPSTKKVGDAIIRPNGQIIRTDPRDTLIATRSGMGGITFIVQGNLIGLDEADISRRLSNELARKVSI